MSQEKTFQILVVDDEPPICDILSRVSQKLFPEASFANTQSALETLDHLDQYPDKLPQLILLDIDLKQAVDGLDLLPQLLERLKKQVPIVVFSGQNAEPVLDRIYQLGAVAYTQKPSNLQDWKNYVIAMRDFWYGTARLPTTAHTVE